MPDRFARWAAVSITLGLLLHAEHAPDEEAAKQRARDAVEALLRLFPPPQ